MRLLAALAAALLATCSPEELKEQLAASACHLDLTTGEVATAVKIGEANEGIAFGPDGRMYVSTTQTGTIYAVSADGTKVKFATTPSALGLAFVDDDLFVAGFDSAEIYKVDAAGKSAVYGGPVTKPNFITPTPWGTLLVSNDFASLISEVTATGASTWSDTLYSPNGMAFTEAGDALYVVTTFADEPALWRIPVAAKQPGMPEKVFALPAGSTPDGMTLASDGTVVVALNTGGKLVRIDPVAKKQLLEVPKLTFPASVAFGRGGFDPCSAYVTQLFGKEVHRVSLGVTGR